MAVVRLRLTAAQGLTILACLVPLYALVGLDVWQRHGGPPTRGTGYVLTRDVPAGTRLAAGDLASVTLTYSPSDFSYLTSPPVDAIVAKPLHQGRLLSVDDLLPADAATAVVSVQVTDPPPITQGSMVDVYVALTGDLRRIGAHLPVVSVQPLTVRVPAADTAAWLALTSAHTPMVVSLTTDTTSAGPAVIDTCAALALLSGAPCGSASTAATGSGSTAAARTPAAATASPRP